MTNDRPVVDPTTEAPLANDARAPDQSTWNPSLPRSTDRGSQRRRASAGVALDYEVTTVFSSLSTAFAEFPTFLTAALSCSGETPSFRDQ